LPTDNVNELDAIEVHYMYCKELPSQRMGAFTVSWHELVHAYIILSCICCSNQHCRRCRLRKWKLPLWEWVFLQRQLWFFLYGC